MCAAVPVRALLQLPLLGVNRGYKGLYGGGWPLRGMGAAGTALGAADARTNEHYEIGTILTQKSQGAYLRVHTKRRSSKNTLKVLDTHEATPRATDKSHDKSPQYRRVQSVRNEERFRYHAACAAWLGNRPPHARLG